MGIHCHSAALRRSHVTHRMAASDPRCIKGSQVKQVNQIPQDSQFKPAGRCCCLNTRYKTRALPLLFESKPVFKYIILQARWKESERFNSPFSSPAPQRFLAELLSTHHPHCTLGNPNMGGHLQPQSSPPQSFPASQVPLPSTQPRC